MTSILATTKGILAGTSIVCGGTMTVPRDYTLMQDYPMAGTGATHCGKINLYFYLVDTK